MIGISVGLALHKPPKLEVALAEAAGCGPEPGWFGAWPSLGVQTAQQKCASLLTPRLPMTQGWALQQAAAPGAAGNHHSPLLAAKTSAAAP